MNAGLSMEDISAILDAKNEAQLVDLLKRAAFSLGFEQFVMGVEVNRPLVKPVQHAINGYTQRWQQVYAERNFLWQDPTVSHCQTNSEPLVWSEKMYSDGSRELWEESHKYGVGHGVSIPVHERVGVKSMFNLARDQSIVKDPRELEVMLAGARVLASSAHFAATKLIVPGLLDARDPRLTRRERECLIWAPRERLRLKLE